MARFFEKVLLVEGSDDFHVVNHLWKSCGFQEKFFNTESCESDERVLRELELKLSSSKESRPRYLGIVLDADKKGPSSRYDAIKQRLISPRYHAYAKYDLPKELDSKGTIITPRGENYPVIGIWIMPDNLSMGMLEDFLARLAPEDAMDFAKECVDISKERGFSSFKEVHRSKAEIHTYLAWQNEPGNTLGNSIDAHALDVGLPTAKAFINFLKTLFGYEG